MITEQTAMKLCGALGLSYCHPNHCGCGEDSHLLFTRQSDAYAGEMTRTVSLTCGDLYEAIKLPDWINGAPPDEVYEWAQKTAWQNRFLRDRMEIAGMRIYRRFE
jgi:hypothetical protein